MVLRARCEDIHQKVDIAGQVEIVVTDCCHGGRGRDTAGPDFRELSLPEAQFPRTLFSGNSDASGDRGKHLFTPRQRSPAPVCGHGIRSGYVRVLRTHRKTPARIP
jgi:hypothetical protein